MVRCNEEKSFHKKRSKRNNKKPKSQQQAHTNKNLTSSKPNKTAAVKRESTVPFSRPLRLLHP
jgi:hypothetical protein